VTAGDADYKAGPFMVCAHIWSREMGVRIRRSPFAISVCEWCGRTRLRAVNPNKLAETLRNMGEAA
jgi:hypothetical protein